MPTCDIYRAGNSPPAAPDVAGASCTLIPCFERGREAGETEATNLRFTHVLLTAGSTDIRDAFDAFTGGNGDTVYIPNKNGIGYKVRMVESLGSGGGVQKRAYLDREAVPWPFPVNLLLRTSGGQQIGGKPTVYQGRVFVTRAGAQIGGKPSVYAGRTLASSGGLQLGGKRDIHQGRFLGTSGGLQIGGVPTIYDSFWKDTSGGAQIGGAPDIRHGRFLDTSGGLQLGGQPRVAKYQAKLPSGGLNIGGQPTVYQGRNKATSGGLQIGGQPTVTFAPNGPTTTNLYQWLKCDTISGLNDGDAMSVTFNDSGPNGYNMSQATSAYRPIYKTNQVNGKPALYFDSSTNSGKHHLSTGSGNLPTGACTYIAVAKRDSGGTSLASIMGGDNSNRPVFGVWKDNTGGAGTQDKLVIAKNNVDLGVDSTSTFTSSDGWKIISVKYDTVNAAFKIGSTACGTPAYTKTFSTTGGWHLGADYLPTTTGSSCNWFGHIAEVLVYSAAISDADWTNNINYLAAKYGL